MEINNDLGGLRFGYSGDTYGYKKVGADTLYPFSAKTVHTGTYTYPVNSTGGTYDMGEEHTYRYVNATNVYNKGKADVLYYVKKQKTSAEGVSDTYTINTGFSTIKCIIILSDYYNVVGGGEIWAYLYHKDINYHRYTPTYENYYNNGAIYGHINAPWGSNSGTFYNTWIGQGRGELHVESISGGTVTLKCVGQPGAYIYIYIISQ